MPSRIVSTPMFSNCVEGAVNCPLKPRHELLASLPRIPGDLGKGAAWEALAFSPPFSALLSAGIETLKDPDDSARSLALGTLLKVFPEQRAALVKRCESETDQFIRYELARSFVAGSAACGMAEAVPARADRA
jgi:hypothetical protein